MHRKADKSLSLTQQHVLQRLDEVEKEKRQPYRKRKEPFKSRSIMMAIILMFIVGMMMMRLFNS